jgi:hypothetical protein
MREARKTAARKTKPQGANGLDTASHTDLHRSTALTCSANCLASAYLELRQIGRKLLACLLFNGPVQGASHPLFDSAPVCVRCGWRAYLLHTSMLSSTHPQMGVVS